MLNQVLLIALFIGAAAEPASVVVTVDTSEAPDLAPWAANAEKVVRQWHPKIAELLASDGFQPPTTVLLVFKKDHKGVAATSGSKITISADWVRRHPDDIGMVVHELTHVIQRYPGYKAGWLVEGIADYIRCFHFEPDKRLPPIDTKKASYRDGYKTTARFLHWIETKHDPQLVSKLNAALRAGHYDDKLFETSTGQPLDQLWSDFLATLEPGSIKKDK